jgi:hypothetical protein
LYAGTIGTKSMSSMVVLGCLVVVVYPEGPNVPLGYRF